MSCDQFIPNDAEIDKDESSVKVHGGFILRLMFFYFWEKVLKQFLIGPIIICRKQARGNKMQIYFYRLIKYMFGIFRFTSKNGGRNFNDE